MKSMLHFSAGLLIMAAIVFSGCKKALEDISTQEIVQACQIEKITYSGIETLWLTDSIKFTYDAYGNPVSAIRPDATTGYTNFLWRYDTRHRITDQIDLYGVDLATSAPPEDWHRFFYDNKGRIAEDSDYNFPAVVDGHPAPGLFGSARIFNYNYDDYDRLISLTSIQNGMVEFTYSFSYDRNGNLTGQTYDDKINFHRCNKIWQFLSFDYSVNNPLTATYKYDRLGLPVTINGTGENDAAEMMDGLYGALAFGQATIEYDCR